MSYTDASFAPKHSKARKALVVVLVLIAIVIGSRFLETGSLRVLPSPEVEISAGTATLYRTDASDPVILSAGNRLNIQESDEIASGPNCKATISLGDNRSLEMQENTRMTLLDTDWDIAARSNPAWVALDEGQAMVRVAASKLATSPLRIDTDTVTIEAENATFICSVPDRDHSRVAVFDGQVTISMGREQIIVSGGQSLDATIGYPLQARMMSDSELAAQPTALPVQASPPLSPIAVTPTASALGSMSAASTSQGIVYTVQSGDTLFGIARKYGVDWNTLWEANKATVPAPEQLKAGQTLVIPSAE